MTTRLPLRAVLLAFLPTAALAAAPSFPARVFVDTSGSMQGYFGANPALRDAGRTLSNVHGEIAASLSELGLGTPRVCTVGTGLKCDGGPKTPAQLGEAARYNEAASRLDLVLVRNPVPAQVDPNAPPPADLLDEARLTLLVTDGMQAAGGKAVAGASAECAQGADPTCIRGLLQRRIDEGFGVWLVGVLLPFHGTYYPERAISASYFAKVQEHVKALKFDTRNLGVPFRTGAALGADGANASYLFQGFRPLLVFAFSREPELGRALVQRLSTKLRAAPIQPGKMKPADTVQTLEVAPLTATAVSAAKLEVLSQAEQKQVMGATRFNPVEFAEFKLLEGKAFGSGLSHKAWCGARGKSLLALRHATGTPGVLPAFFTEQVVLGGPEGTFPAGAIAAPKPLAGGRTLTGVNCAVLPPNPDHVVSFALQTRAVLDATKAGAAWWSRSGWSADNSWEMPERIYGLEELVGPLLQSRSARPTTWGKVVLHLRRD